MYVYICPYCMPSPKAKLAKTIMSAVKCNYDKENICEDKHKCKEVMECKVCKAQFKITKTFLREQKRKIKDG